jgi:hypothetical protein
MFPTVFCIAGLKFLTFKPCNNAINNSGKDRIKEYMSWEGILYLMCVGASDVRKYL